MEQLFPLDLNKVVSLENQANSGVTHASDLAIMIEARPQRDGSRTTLFTKDHFREMIKLEEYIMNLQAPQRLTDVVTPESISFYDLCRKKNITDEIIQNYADEACKSDEKFCV